MWKHVNRVDPGASIAHPDKAEEYSLPLTSTIPSPTPPAIRSKSPTFTYPLWSSAIRFGFRVGEVNLSCLGAAQSLCTSCSKHQALQQQESTGNSHKSTATVRVLLQIIIIMTNRFPDVK